MNEHTSWVEVDRSALRHNMGQVKQTVGVSVKVMAVVKADAYGHGIVETSRVFESAGADFLGVTTLEEGLDIRRGGVALPVLIFSPLLPGQIELAIENDLDQTVCCLDFLDHISTSAQHMNKTARVHVKIDTGMGRIGVFPRVAAEFMAQLKSYPCIEIVGTYTHFANAGRQDLVHAREQNSIFAETIQVLRKNNFDPGVVHAANSAALLSMPESHYDMVRPGTILYGQYPSKHVAKRLDLKETWRLKTHIVALKQIPAGTHVGYGSEFTSGRTMTMGVIPLGYSDGFTLVPESVAKRRSNPLVCVAETLLKRTFGPGVAVRGKRCGVVGRVSMQLTSIDVSSVPDVQIGDEVIVPARRTTTSGRIARVYIGE